MDIIDFSRLIIPKKIKEIGDKLSENKFQAYVVGGCVRDLILNKKPKDWDITTNAIPEEILKIFKDGIYENRFGTVGVKTDDEDLTLKIVEITTFRLEGKYSDKRHPDAVIFAKSINEDLARRDFTINAMAIDLCCQRDSACDNERASIVDPFNGLEDLKIGLIKAVGNTAERFEEDALRLLRAIRFATELDFQIEKNTWQAILKKAELIKLVSQERCRDELTKLLMAKEASRGIKLMVDSGLLNKIIPELAEGINVAQNKHHIYTVFEHNVRALDYASKKDYGLDIRMASLLHDVAKPRVKEGEGLDSTFYGHELLGARMTSQILKRLKFSNDIIKKVCHLVRYHLFYYNVDEVTEAGVRRFIKRVGSENIPDLIKVREADRIGSGVPKAVPYRIRHLLFMIEKVGRDPTSPKMLKINGNDIMAIAKLTPGPKIGQILNILLDEILNDPSKNERNWLEDRTRELANLSDGKLKNLSQNAKERKEEFEGGVETEIKKKYHV